MPLDFSRCKLTPFQHQREDTERALELPFFFIASEMRTGKSFIVVMTAQFLFEQDTIDKVVIVAPAPVRDVWYDPKLGEIAKHSWEDGPPTSILEFSSRVRAWFKGDPKAGHKLEYYITNYELLRSKQRLAQLLPACGPRTLLVLDESSYIKNHKSAQTKACLQLRRASGRVILLNGTPIFHSPLDLFSQGNMLSPDILDCKYVTQFKARYATQTPIRKAGGGVLLDKWNRPILKIEKWSEEGLKDLQRRFAPYTVRRLQRECLDMPPKLDPVTLTATLTPETWSSYLEMRDELMIWLQSGNVSTSTTAAIKALRLSQITSGFLGGIERTFIETVDHWNELDDVPEPDQVPDLVKTKELGHEKLDVLLWFLEQQLEADENFHVVVWCRYRPELFRMMEVVAQKFPQFTYGKIHGAQRKDERLRALSLLKPETSPAGPVFVGGTFGTASFGLDMTAAHTSVTMSSDYSPGKFAQSADRMQGPAQTHPIAYFDIVAVGPRGQRTIDHDILAARISGEDVATRTASAWVRALTEE